MAKAPRNIILVGFMASGKTSVGRALADGLSESDAPGSGGGWTLVDADDVIVARAGKPIHRIFAEDGESAFRDLESRVIADLCAGERQVIASGGGSFVSERNREVMLAGGRVFFLSASPATILRRGAGGGRRRPHTSAAVAPAGGEDDYDPEARIAELLAQRMPAYSQAHHTIETDGLTAEGVAAEIAGICGIAVS